jgi:hypothetical protein
MELEYWILDFGRRSNSSGSGTAALHASSQPSQGSYIGTFPLLWLHRKWVSLLTDRWANSFGLWDWKRGYGGTGVRRRAGMMRRQWFINYCLCTRDVPRSFFRDVFCWKLSSLIVVSKRASAVEEGTKDRRRSCVVCIKHLLFKLCWRKHT